MDCMQRKSPDCGPRNQRCRMRRIRASQVVIQRNPFSKKNNEGLITGTWNVGTILLAGAAAAQGLLVGGGDTLVAAGVVPPPPPAIGVTSASPTLPAAVHSAAVAPSSGGSLQYGLANGDEPDFIETIKNVTVAVGREAILSCSVTELDNYKVGWMKAEDQTILTLHNKVVTHNSRISVTHDGHRTWNLHIRQVKEADRGCYMCQINTNVMKKQIGCVDVHVPPDISDAETSSDITVQEGENATLQCRATGHPSPRIVWRREDGESLIIRKGFRDITRQDTIGGDVLTLVKLDRKQMGAYLCIASNDVPPAVSKRITLNVNFAPVIKVPNQLLGAPLGTDVHLECHVEAFPNTINYWIKNRGEMLLDGRKHIIEEDKNSYKVHLKLTIRTFNKRDIGTYTCVSTNSLGRADGTVRLYEIKMPTRMPIGSTENQVVTQSGLHLSTQGTKAKDTVFTTFVSPVEAVSTVEPWPMGALGPVGEAPAQRVPTAAEAAASAEAAAAADASAHGRAASSSLPTPRLKGGGVYADYANPSFETVWAAIQFLLGEVKKYSDVNSRSNQNIALKVGYRLMM
ncbi:protein amalgam-like [Hetaerina americana]|uniref:protein amalgam-like n=1 Tax=Hetaerina americana TaxID=62018 RepID=UPI003A7F22D2